MRPIVLALALGCAPAPTPDSPPTLDPETPGSRPPPPSPAPAPAKTPGFVDRDQGQQHPPLPADSPGWEWDAGGFVADWGWYGEHSWHDVRMRVVGHLAVAAWVEASAQAQTGRLLAGAQALDRFRAVVQALPAPPDGPAADHRRLLLDAAARDALLLKQLSEGALGPPRSGAASSLAGLRAQWLRIATQSQPSAEALRALQAALEPHLVPREDLSLDGFANFKDRHALRARLWAAWADALDPLSDHGPWGYWEADDAVLEAWALGLAAGFLGGTDWTARAEDAFGTPLVAPTSDTGAIYSWPSDLAAQLRTQDPARFSAEELGSLPTGDSLIDVGGSPGPRAIGTLERLGLDDAEHRQRLEQEAKALNDALEGQPESVLAQVRALASSFDALAHGSRFYNVKAVRNAGVRQLARQGRPDLARALVADQFPLHHQDWACPNRAGILQTLDARLLLAEGKVQLALDRLEEAQATAAVFLEQVAAAEAAGPGRGPGARPPWMQAGRPPQRPSGKARQAPQSTPGGPSTRSSRATSAGDAPGSSSSQR